MPADSLFQTFHFDRRLPLDLDLGPVHIHAYSSGVFFLWATVALLIVGGAAVFLARQRQLIDRWASWTMIALVAGVAIWLGPATTAALTAVAAIAAVREYGRLVKLGRVDLGVLMALALFYPFAAWLRPSLLNLAPFLVLACALPAVLGGDVENGSRRAAFTAFGSVWICWAAAQLVVLGSQGYLVCFAAAVADVAAWCGGKGLRRLSWARRPLSRLSPSKTIGGLVGAFIGGLLALLLLGTISVGLVVAVVFGGVLGDLLESMVKRHAQVKDAGSWLPGFGGLLDRIDSLLLVVPLAYLLGNLP